MKELPKLSGWMHKQLAAISIAQDGERTHRLQRRELPASTKTALQLRGTAAAYTLSTGVNSRATHGILLRLIITLNKTKINRMAQLLT